jgi:hypothetical protein
MPISTEKSAGEILTDYNLIKFSANQELPIIDKEVCQQTEFV